MTRACKQRDVTQTATCAHHTRVPSRPYPTTKGSDLTYKSCVCRALTLRADADTQTRIEEGKAA